MDERFWSKVDTSGDCWLWTGASNGQYGWVKRFGRLLTAHRYSFLMVFGAVPTDHDVCHHCDTPLCVRPSHLFAGTRSENMLDASRKGRLGHVTHPERLPRGAGHYLFGQLPIRSRNALGRFQ